MTGAKALFELCHQSPYFLKLFAFKVYLIGINRLKKHGYYESVYEWKYEVTDSR